MADRIRIRVDTAALQRLGTSPAGPIYRHMVTLGGRVETAAKRNASGLIVGVRTGTLRSSISAAQPELRGTHLVVPVVAAAAYAVAVHEGTRPHDIVPVRKRVLAWKGPDGPVFARRAHHSGTKARPFLRDALTVIR